MALNLLARVWLARTDIHFNASQFNEGLADARTALRVLEKVAPVDLRQRADLALARQTAYTLIGDATWFGGNEKGAVPFYEASRAALADPAFDADARILKRRAYTTYTVASALSELGNPAAAARLSAAGLAEVAHLDRFDRSNSARRMGNVLRDEYSQELLKLGRVSAALQQNDIVVATSRHVARTQPNNYQVARSFAVTLSTSGQMHRSSGNTAQACARFREADAVWAGLSQSGRVNGFDRANDMKQNTMRLEACPKS